MRAFRLAKHPLDTASGVPFPGHTKAETLQPRDRNGRKIPDRTRKSVRDGRTVRRNPYERRAPRRLLCFASPEIRRLHTSFRLLGENSPLFNAATFRFNAKIAHQTRQLDHKRIKKATDFQKKFTISLKNRCFFVVTVFFRKIVSQLLAFLSRSHLSVSSSLSQSGDTTSASGSQASSMPAKKPGFRNSQS